MICLEMTGSRACLVSLFVFGMGVGWYGVEGAYIVGVGEGRQGVLGHCVCCVSVCRCMLCVSVGMCRYV